MVLYGIIYIVNQNMSLSLISSKNKKVK